MMDASVKYSMVLVLPLAAALALGACAPKTDAQRLANAEAACFERAYNAVWLRGSVGAGFSSQGPYSGLSLSITSDALAKRDPEQLYESCVIDKTGHLPTQNLYSRLDWRG